MVADHAATAIANARAFEQIEGLHNQLELTHRVAISNHRLVDFTNGKLTFRWGRLRYNTKIYSGAPVCWPTRGCIRR